MEEGGGGGPWLLFLMPGKREEKEGRKVEVIFHDGERDLSGGEEGKTT